MIKTRLYADTSSNLLSQACKIMSLNRFTRIVLNNQIEFGQDILGHLNNGNCYKFTDNDCLCGIGLVLA